MPSSASRKAFAQAGTVTCQVRKTADERQAGRRRASRCGASGGTLTADPAALTCSWRGRAGCRSPSEPGSGVRRGTAFHRASLGKYAAKRSPPLTPPLMSAQVRPRCRTYAAGRTHNPPIQAGDHTRMDDLRATARSVVPVVSRPESAIWSVRDRWTRSAGVSRCRRGAIQLVEHVSQRADPARLRPVVPASRVAARERAGERGDRRQGQAGPEGGTAVSHPRRVRVLRGHAHPRPGDRLG